MAKKKEEPELKIKTPEENFAEMVAKFKKEKSEKELLAIASKEKTLYDILERMVARQALKELTPELKKKIE